ncbi:MAG TPA: dihydroxyacetone kinase [Chloroflexi bacterium]|nr:dihydroxyacetone kinase [Chloroflexota bacterium]
MAEKPELRCDGQNLMQMLATATAWLEKHAVAINALNVFPVPDGDTGTNMLLTMQAALEEIGNASQGSLGSIAQAAAYGALMGARGNSGVILSQLLRGIANSLDKKQSFGPLEFARAMAEASTMAYKAVIRPVEGTMLTVSKDAAKAAMAAAQEGEDLLTVLEKTVEAAKESVARTPTLLDVLREAGVVDAGGQGLFIILDGILRSLKGEAIEMKEPTEMVPAELPEEAEMEWGYCTEFILQGKELNLAEVREKIASFGDSALAVGDERVIKVHVHTLDPGQVLSYASSLGVLSNIKIDNMQEQHREFLVLGEEAAKAAAEEIEGIATVAVAWGDGLIRVFESLGVKSIVPGGQTMNPSTQELLEAVETLPAKEVIILPNNENIFLAAEQAQKLSRKKVVVVPTATIPQGIGALLAFDKEADLETNTQNMERAIAAIQTVEVTTAVRPAKINGIKIKKGQIIALLNGHLAASGEKIEEVVRQALEKLGGDQYEIITLYYGEDTPLQAAESLADEIRRWYPEQEVECIEGGQPYYHYIISVE